MYGYRNSDPDASATRTMPQLNQDVDGRLYSDSTVDTDSFSDRGSVGSAPSLETIADSSIEDSGFEEE